MYIADRRIFLVVAALFAATIAFSAPLLCQVPYTAQPHGTIVGRVVDSARSPIPGAQVVVARQGDSAVIATGVTDGQGIARLGSIATGGPYNVLVRQIGYAPARDTAVYVRDGQAVELSFALSPHVVTLPEVTVRDPNERTTLLPKLAHRGSFIGIRLLGCLYLGIGDPSDMETEDVVDGCTKQRRMLAAKRRRRAYAEQAKEEERRRAKVAKLLAKARARLASEFVLEAARRVDSTVSVGVRPDSSDALLVYAAAASCGPERLADDDKVICHEVLKRTPRPRLHRLVGLLAALDGAAAPETAETASPSRDSTQHFSVGPALATPATVSIGFGFGR